MHELGVLKHALKQVEQVAINNNIESVKFITLEVGTNSSFVPIFFEKLFPVAIEGIALFKNSKLNIETVEGKNLIIKEIGY